MKELRKSGFTLFELLITMSVISIVAGAGFYTIARSTNDRALEKAANSLHSMVRIARTQAITSGVHSRLIINADSSDPESYLRRIGVVLEGSESISVDDEDLDSVLAVERGVLLPEGVYVVPQSGNVVLPDGLPRSIYKKKNTDPANDTAVYRFDYPLAEPVPVVASGEPEWICIQFSPNGRLSSCEHGGGGLVPRSNQLILSKGQLVGDDVVFGAEDEFVGIAFKLSGSSFSSSEIDLFELEKEDVEEGD